MPTTAIPLAPGAPPATGSYRGAAIPGARPPSDPQIVPPRVARPSTDPRAAPPPAPGQGQAVPPLPPVPAPVAQPPRGDVRTTSRIGTLDQQRDLRPPTHLGPIQPPQNLRPPTHVGPIQPPRGDIRTTSRVAPPAQPVRPKLPPSIDPNARRTPLPGMAPPLAPPLQDPRAARDPRRTSQVMPPEGIPQPLPPPPARQSQPPQPPQRPAPMLDPNDAQSSRIRRTVNGAQQAVSQDGNTARMVACASCGNAFRATIKPQSYNVVCVHCGQLNRIDP